MNKKLITVIVIGFACGAVLLVAGYFVPAALENARFASLPPEEKVRYLAGHITYEDGPGSPVTGISFVGSGGAVNRLRDSDLQVLSHFPDLKKLELWCPLVTDQGGRQLASLTKLETLFLLCPNLGDESMKILAELPELKELYLYRTKVSDTGVGYLESAPNLRVLNLWDTAITDACATSLAKIKSLRLVHLGNFPEPFREHDEQTDDPNALPQCKFSEAGVRQLHEMAPKLKVVLWRKDDVISPENLQLFDGNLADSKTLLAIENNAAPDGADTEVAEASGWPNFLGPTADGHAASGETIRQNWDAVPPKVLWKMHTGEGYSSCAVAHSRFYHLDRLNDRERIICGDADSGEIQWQQEFETTYIDAGGYGNGPRSSPVIDGSRLYIYSPGGMLRCLAARDGEVIWQIDTQSDFGPAANLYGVGSTPVVFENLLIVMIGNSSKDSDQRQAVIAFNKMTGQKVWSAGNDLASYATPKVVLINQIPVCLVFARGGLISLNAKTGDEFFYFPWCARVSGCVNAANPVARENRVLVTEAYGAGSVAIDVDENMTPRVAWQDEKRSREKILRSHWATPVWFQGFLYGCHGRHTNRAGLRCVDWETGEVKWENITNSRVSLLVIDGVLLSVSEHGEVSLIKADPGAWQCLASIDLGKPNQADPESLTNNAPTLTYPVWACPVYVDGKLYVRGKQELVCVEFQQSAD